MDWITGERFETLADYVYAPSIRAKDDYNGLKNTLLVSALKENDIIYTHTMYAKQLFEILKEVKVKIILITHNSDMNVDRSFEIPFCVKKWFTQNVNCEDYFIESIPIGLENSRWFQKEHKKEKMKMLLLQEKDICNTLLVNFNTETNPKERVHAFNIFKDKVWATCKCSKNGFDFSSYIWNVYNHQFVLCPAGNGIDTHRTWEALYMKSIPIEKRTHNNFFYRHLPICFVDEWEEITPEFLKQEYKRIKSFKDWNLNMLDFAYWKIKILSFKYENSSFSIT